MDERRGKKPRSKPFRRPCIKCRKSFKPEDRTRDWYCPVCKKKIGKPTGPREVPDPIVPGDGAHWFDQL